MRLIKLFSIKITIFLFKTEDITTSEVEGYHGLQFYFILLFIHD